MAGRSDSTPKAALVYVAVTPNRPSQVKIGNTLRPALRMRAGQTWLGDLRVIDSKPFLDAYRREGEMKAHFVDHRVDGEWFRVRPEVAIDHLHRLYESEAPRREAYANEVRRAKELGLLDPRVATDINSAVDAILAWQLPRLGATVRALVVAALSDTPAASTLAGRLEQNGFLPTLFDDIVLVDLDEGSRLVAMLDRTIGRGHWEAQMRDIVGFMRDLSPVKLSDWRRRCSAPAPIVSKVIHASRRHPDCAR